MTPASVGPADPADSQTPPAAKKARTDSQPAQGADGKRSASDDTDVEMQSKVESKRELELKHDASNGHSKAASAAAAQPAALHTPGGYVIERNSLVRVLVQSLQDMGLKYGLLSAAS